MITNVGLNHFLNVELHDATQVATWYVGLKGTGAMAAGDTLASHGNWSEITDYAGNRKEYVEAESSAQSTTNSASPASFAIDDDATVDGAFLASADSGTDGTLLCGKDFTSSRTLADGDTLNVTYQITAANA
jgi:hypothetical protein